MTNLPPDKRDRAPRAEPGIGRPLPPPDPAQRVGNPRKRQPGGRKPPEAGSALPPPEPTQRVRRDRGPQPRADPGGPIDRFDTTATGSPGTENVQGASRPQADAPRQLPEGPTGKQYRKHKNREAAPTYGPGRLLLRLLIVAAIWIVASLAFRFVHDPWSPPQSAGLSDGSWRTIKAVTSYG